MTLREFLQDPRYVPWALDLAGDRMLFARMNRRALRESTFLDVRIARTAPSDLAIPIPEILSELRRPSPEIMAAAPTHFIFHHAFCGSTLLARCLEPFRNFLVLKEPWSLTQLSQPRVRRRKDRDRLTAGLIALLGRPFSAGQAVVIKSGQVGSALPKAILDARPDRRAVLLYSDLESFLLAVLKSDARGQWLRSRTPPRDRSLAFPEAIARHWLAEMSAFSRLMAPRQGKRCLPVDFHSLLRSPEQVTLGVAAHFGAHLRSSRVEEALRTQILGRHSKNPEETYSKEGHFEERERLLAEYRSEVRLGLDWAGSRARDVLGSFK
jgi:hypothetical protein